MKQINILKEIENQFDSINANYGSKEELCIYCKAKEYDSKVGVIHYSFCPLIKLREIIENGEEVNKISLKSWRNKKRRWKNKN